QRVANNTGTTQSMPENKSATAICSPVNCLNAVLYIPQPSTLLTTIRIKNSGKNIKNSSGVASCIDEPISKANPKNPQNPTTISPNTTAYTPSDCRTHTCHCSTNIRKPSLIQSPNLTSDDV